MGYLLAWLHPDRSAGVWPISLAARVISAWQFIDRGREDESPTVRLPVRSRSRHSHRMPWIPMPVEATRKSRYWHKILRITLLGLVLAGVALTTGVFSYQNIQLVSATKVFAASPASRNVSPLDR
jgi:hypothetical protein